MKRTVAVIALAAASFLVVSFTAHAAHTPEPSSVTVAGSLQSELGCPGDWSPDCASTHLILDADDGVWQAVFAITAGAWEYKAALDDSWNENYGMNATPNGPNIALNLGADEDVKFYYDHKTHWITDSVNTVIAVAAGSFQDEMGCPGDWQPDCLRSWLQDTDGDGVYRFTTALIPAGSYEARTAMDEGWVENYGAGGAIDGANITVTVPVNGTPMLFAFNLATHVLSISVVAGSDEDGDGYQTPADCDDDPATGFSINPGADEVCGDGIDNDCDGDVDQDDADCASGGGGGGCNTVGPAVPPWTGLVWIALLGGLIAWRRRGRGK